MRIRPYDPKDYPQIASLYRQSHLYGGQFDENRDSAERLQKRIEADPDAILVAEIDGSIVGTISLIEDGRVAWLFRFAVAQGKHEAEATNLLYESAVRALKAKAHTQVLVYSPEGNLKLDERYARLGFHPGGSYTCYWKNIGE
jgi:predicted N-acetyltransferase YhbS